MNNYEITEENFVTKLNTFLVTMLIVLLAVGLVEAKTIKEGEQEYTCSPKKTCEEQLKAAKAEIARLKKQLQNPVVVEKVKETKIKKHIISVVAVDNIKNVESKNISPSSASTEARTDLVPALSYQYQTDSGLTPLVGLTFANKTKLIFGLGFEF